MRAVTSLQRDANKILGYSAQQTLDYLQSLYEKKLGICPVCGADIIEWKQSYSCTNRDCRFALWKDNRFLQSIGKNLTRDLAVKLISGEKVKLKKCVSRKSGKTFDAMISVTADAEGKASFSMELPQKGGRK